MMQEKTAGGNDDFLSQLFEQLRRFHEFSPFQEHIKDIPFNLFIAQLTSLAQAYQGLITKLVENPDKLHALQRKYYIEFFELQRDMFLYWLGNENIFARANAAEKDKRFQHEWWRTHPFYVCIREFYLFNVRHIIALLNEVEDLDPLTARKLRFYVQMLIDTFSPSNFVFTNPEILYKTFKTNGKNLAQGLQKLLADFKAGRTLFNIPMTDFSAFTVGKNVAATPGKVIFQNDLIQLIQYKPQTEQVYERPLLIIPPWINKYYILDLSENNSYVNWIVRQGYTVFIISWVNPDERHAYKDFADYLLEGAYKALEVVESAIGQRGVNVLGFCIGGTLTGCLLAYLTAINQSERVSSATYLATLLDFSDSGDMQVFIDENQIAALEKQMEKKGYLDGGYMSVAFNLLRANDLIWSYYVNNYLSGEDPPPLDLLFWNSDITNMPAKMHSTYLRNMYLKNLLVEPSAIKINGVGIDLTKIKTPVYFLSTQNDHIAPWKTTYLGMLLHAGERNFVLGKAGHIAGVVNSPAAGKYGYYINEAIPAMPEAWFANAKEQTGSWWVHWEQWLRKFSGKKVAAREPGIGALPPLEDAPGSYVKRKIK